MRKSDKRNKPELDKIGTNKIGRLKPSKEEKRPNTGKRIDLDKLL